MIHAQRSWVKLSFKMKKFSFMTKPSSFSSGIKLSFKSSQVIFQVEKYMIIYILIYDIWIHDGFGTKQNSVCSQNKHLKHLKLLKHMKYFIIILTVYILTITKDIHFCMLPREKMEIVSTITLLSVWRETRVSFCDWSW